MWTRLDMIRREGRAGDEEAERDAGTNGVCTVAQRETGGQGSARPRGTQEGNADEKGDFYWVQCSSVL